MEREIIEWNKLIAEFMEAHQDMYKKWFYKGYINGVHFLGYDVSEFKYHSSWDWLHPVIQKIRDWYNLDNKDVDAAFDVIKLGISEDIETVYKAVVSFIQWHNQSKHSTTKQD